ncbi:MAG: copper resistance protein B [Rickettsiales bacterium]|nr:copper resistance protein B [Rickettsiales bacterium]
MKIIDLFLTWPFLLITPAFAQGMDQSMPGMAMPSMQPNIKAESTPKKTANPSAITGMKEEVGNESPPEPPTDYAADQFYNPVAMADARAQLQDELGGTMHSRTWINVAEYQIHHGQSNYRWDGETLYGGDINRFVVKSEGSGSVDTGVIAGEIQGVFSRAISPYFDLQAGIRQDLRPTPMRTYATMGFEGLSPYWFEVNGAVFVSTQGEVLGRLESTYDLNVTQRWILQPRAEINFAAQSVQKTGAGSGVSNVELALRLRYEVRREFAPYIGISVDTELGKTADYSRARGDEPQQVSFVMGIRTLF